MSFWLETRMWLDDKIICRTFWLLKLYKYISCLVCLWVQNNNNIHHHLLFLLVCNLRRHRQRKTFIELLVAAAGLTIHPTRAQHRQDRKKASSQFFINITSPGEKSFIHPVISNQVSSVSSSGTRLILEWFCGNFVASAIWRVEFIDKINIRVQWPWEYYHNQHWCDSFGQLWNG